MSDAPERLWIDTKDGHAPNWKRQPPWASTEYVRADLFTALEAQLAVADRLADAVEACRYIALESPTREAVEKFVLIGVMATAYRAARGDAK